MILRIPLGLKDKFILDKIATEDKKRENHQPQSYKNKVVLKPWGYEFLIFENECVAIWHLHIKNQHSTSMHCHPKKKTSLTVLKGKALSNTFQHRNYFEGLSGTIIEKGVFHSTRAESFDGIDLIELETPPNKLDLVRLNDAYGRQKEGYEGLTEMETINLDRYNFYYFEEPSTPVGQVFERSGCILSISAYQNQEEFIENFSFEPNSYYQICRGNVFNNEQEELYELGDSFSFDMVSQKEHLLIKEKTVIIKIHKVSTL